MDFWYETPYIMTNTYQEFLWNTGNYLPYYMVLALRRADHPSKESYRMSKI
jgi:hypothetical protein